MLKQYLALTLLLCTGSLVASQTAPNYPQFKAEVVTALNNIYREKIKGHEKPTDLQVVNEKELTDLINKDSHAIEENVLGDLRQEQKEIAQKLGQEPANEQLQRQAKKIAAHIETLEATLNKVAPAIDTSAHRAAKSATPAKQPAYVQYRPVAIIVVAAPRPEPRPAVVTPKQIIPDRSNVDPMEAIKKSTYSKSVDNIFENDLLRTKLEATGILNNHDKYPTSQPAASFDADAEFERFRNRQAEQSLEQLVLTLNGVFRATNMPPKAIVKIADYAQQDWIKPNTQPKAPVFRAPAGYDEAAALRRALAESAAATTRSSSERDLKEHPPVPKNLSSAASYGAPSYSAARPTTATSAQPISAQEQAAIEAAVRQSLMEAKERETREQELKKLEMEKWSRPAFVVPHSQKDHRDSRDLQAVLNGYKKAFLVAGVATSAVALAYFAKKLSM